ncbi:MAG: thioredoxin family protein [Rhodoferax sp.]|nr:thioredoxin family protein [Rhodoferax sp.]
MEMPYDTAQPERSQIDALGGAVVLDFGTNWCGYCKRASPAIAEALAGHPSVRHIKVEDGSGRPLGRSFAVRLWPTLVFLRDGREVTRLVRPGGVEQVGEALAQLLNDTAPRQA